MLRPIFESLMERIVAVEPRAWDVLNPGVSDEQISAFSEAIGLPITGDVRELFTLVNGVNHDLAEKSPVQFSFPSYFYYHMLSLKEIKETVDDIRATDYYDGTFPPEWLPLFTDNSGSYIVVDTSNNNCIVSVDVEPSLVGDEMIKHRSLSSMLRCLLCYFEEGAYTVGSEGILDEDVEKMRQIGLREEGLPYWRKY
jgi:hypothetical protein